MSVASTGSRQRTRTSSSLRPPSSSSEVVLEEDGDAPSSPGRSLPRGLKDLFVLTTVLKILLFPAYRSTDFEVHRNWLAITRSLPMSSWYYDTTSEWTLDYPPFFAHFEHILSYPASLLDPLLTTLSSTPLSSPTITAFQRSSVILSEAFLLGLALVAFVKTAKDPAVMNVIVGALWAHPGWLIIDHIHFQYNGAMFGILLWSIYHAKQNNLLACGALFAILLNFKHIYIYMAPPYFVYLLRAYCFDPNGSFKFSNLVKLGSTVIAIFVVSLGPFIQHLPQLGSRLFPFTRGLNHAYWAGNVWALVTVADRALLKFGSRLGLNLSVDQAGVASSTRGFVGDTVFAVLPNIKPIHCFVLTIALQVIFSVKLWFRPTYKVFVWALTISGFTSFLFGWHVHEKAVLLFLVPLSLLAAENYAFFRTFVIASVAGIFSLFPLLFTPLETPIKIGYSLVWFLLSFSLLSRSVYRPPPTIVSTVVHSLETLYLALFVPLQLFVSVLHPLLLRRASPEGGSEESFLPLMMVSTYAALGLVWTWARLAWIGLRGGEWEGDVFGQEGKEKTE